MSLKGLLRLSLILAVFLAQWALFAHDYQDHDAGHVCEICVGSSSIAHALPSSPPELAAACTLVLVSMPGEATQAPLRLPRHYDARGPPAALS